MLACAALAATLAVWRCRGDDGARRAPMPVCELGPTTPGIDVSYYQNAIRWQRVRAAGIVFAFIRVSDGTTVLDPRFAANWANARSAGVLRGAYQYFRPDQSPIAQADLLIAALAHDPGELPPVIDVEADGGRPPRQIADRVRTWVARIRARLGVEPIIYTGPEFWRDKVGGADLTSQPLWIAHYTDRCPSVPAPWTTWSFWQHTDSGAVPGITGPVDLNLFAGTADQLVDLTRRSQIAR